MRLLTIQLTDEVDQRLRAVSSREQRSPEETAAEILRKRLALDRFHDLCRESEMLAKAAGFTSEDDLLRSIS
jgi:plasmid stability protein